MTRPSREEIDAQYERAYREHPLDEPDEWGDLASWCKAAGRGASMSIPLGWDESVTYVEAMASGTCFSSDRADVDVRTDRQTAILAADRRVVRGVDGQDIGIGCVLQAHTGGSGTSVDHVVASDVGGSWTATAGGGTDLARPLGSFIDHEVTGRGALLTSGWSAGFGGQLDGWVVVACGVLLDPAAWVRFGKSEIALPGTGPRFFAICTVVPETDEDQVVVLEADGGWTFEVTVSPW